MFCSFNTIINKSQLIHDTDAGLTLDALLQFNTLLSNLTFQNWGFKNIAAHNGLFAIYF